MPDFIRYEHPVLSPTVCFVCQTHVGPMWLLRHHEIVQAVQLCETCITQLARCVGCSDPGVAEALREQTDRQSRVIEELEDMVRIEQRRQIRVVSLDEAKKLLSGEIKDDEPNGDGIAHDPPRRESPPGVKKRLTRR